MTTSFLKLALGLSSTVFSSVLLSQVVFAAEAPTVQTETEVTIDRQPESLQPVSQYSQDGAIESQVTSISQLSDVRPTDWAFQALQSLVERYGCIAGYPDKTYRGNRALTRYEFAAGLNSCLDRVNELIAASTADLVKKEDLATLQRLQEEFAAELATLRGRVDSLEARTTTLEKQQFSTTTKLIGNVVFGVLGAFGGDKAVSSSAGLVARPPGQSGAPGPTIVPAQPRTKVNDNIIFSDRVRLVLTSSFTGRDKLIARLQAGNTPSLADATGATSSKLAFQSASGNSVSINQLEYRFPIGDRGTAYLEAFGFLDLFVPTLHPLDGDYDTVLTGFSLRSPIYFPSGVSGAGFNYNLSNSINVGGGYLAGTPTANDPKTGLTGGPYGALGQITFRPNNSLAVALTYLNAYDNGSGNAPPGGFFGSQNSAFPFGAAPVITNGYGVEAEYRFNPNFSLSGWYYLGDAKSQGGATKGASATIQAWAVALAFPDLGKKGNLGGLIVGMPSKTTSNDISGFKDPNTSIQVEAFYRYTINDHVGITPGLVLIANPEHNSANDTIYLGVIRTTFNF